MNSEFDITAENRKDSSVFAASTGRGGTADATDLKCVSSNHVSSDSTILIRDCEEVCSSAPQSDLRFLRVLIPGGACAPFCFTTGHPEEISFGCLKQVHYVNAFTGDMDLACAVKNLGGGVYPFGDWYLAKCMDAFPQYGGSYMFCAGGEIQYIGSSENLYLRMSAHRLRFDEHGKSYWPFGHIRIGVAVWLDIDPGDHVAQEKRLIESIRPPFNVRGIDERVGKGLSVFPSTYRRKSLAGRAQ